MVSAKLIALAVAGVGLTAAPLAAVARTSCKFPFANMEPEAGEQDLQNPPMEPAKTGTFPPPQNTCSRQGQTDPGTGDGDPDYGRGTYGRYRPPANDQTQTDLHRTSKSGRAAWSGFGNIETSLDGRVRSGVAAMDRSGTGMMAESVVDVDLRGEADSITDGGLEYGAGLRVRVQRDRFRRGFGGQAGDCPATDAACTGTFVAGVARAVKGHTSQFYTSGANDARETGVALEGAYIFLRSAYGDFNLGRDDGAASLFSLGAPSLVMVNASNSTVDYIGFDSVKTVNDASGFAGKITYTGPRLLGDTVGFGVQVGASYALNATACGVDYCVKGNTTNAADPFAPEISNVFEIGVALDRTFDNGLSAEITGTYARGSEDSGNAAFDDLSTRGAGLELKYADVTFGSSFLKSNNGFAGRGDYTAWDAGFTWQPSQWGVTASYGHSDDDIAHLISDQAVFAISHDLNDNSRLGTGMQYINRHVPVLGAGGRDSRSENAYALFIEAGVRF